VRVSNSSQCPLHSPGADPDYEVRHPARLDEEERLMIAPSGSAGTLSASLLSCGAVWL
jgi:hypothetical protein